MKRYSVRSHRRSRRARWLIAGAIVLGAAALFRSHIWPSGGEASTGKRTQFTISNRTDTLEGISIEPGSNGLYALTLRNESSKIVTGFAYKVGPSGSEAAPTGGHLRESINIAPGALAVHAFGIPQALKKRPMVLTILGVYFIDGSGEGDSGVVLEFRDTEAGYERANYIVKPMIRDLALRNDGELLQAINELILRIRNLPDPPEGTVSFALLAGFRDRKEMASLDIEGLSRAHQEGGVDTIRKRIDEMSDRYEKEALHYQRLEIK
jgi:hypothetical protein